MKRIFHIVTRPSGMIAWNVNKKVAVIENGHFHNLAKTLLKDQGSERDISAFAFGLTTHTKMGDESENLRLQKVLHERIFKKVNEGEISFIYEMSGNEAKTNLDGFLEAYKFNTGHIFYSIADMHDHSDKLINISLRKTPSFFQKMLGKLGDAYDEINILESEVIGVKGNGFEFTLKLKSRVYTFNDNGVYQT